MAITEAAAFVTTLKSAYELVNKIRNSDDKEELKNGAAALADMLWSARAAGLALIEEKALLVDERTKLSQKIKELEDLNSYLADFGPQSEKYKRIQTQMGQFVYCERKPSGDGAPYFCPKCFSNKHASILQGRTDDSWHVCPECHWSADL